MDGIIIQKFSTPEFCKSTRELMIYLCALGCAENFYRLNMDSNTPRWLRVMKLVLNSDHKDDLEATRVETIKLAFDLRCKGFALCSERLRISRDQK